MQTMQQQYDEVRQNGHHETLAIPRTDSVRAYSATSSPEDHRLVTEARANAIFERLDRMKTGGGKLELRFSAWWCGSLRWARNRVSMAGDQRDVELTIVRRTKYGWSESRINQTDDESLRAALVAAERKANMRAPFPVIIEGNGFYGERFKNVLQPYPDTAIWSDATFHVTPEQRARLAQTLAEGAEAQQMLSAGYIAMRVVERQRYGDRIVDSDILGRNNDWMPSNEPPQGEGASRMARDETYQRFTTSQCSMTVRHPKGVGSGWAGLSSFDWAAIDAPALARIALEKCVASLNPVAVEPGRYTVILEPQAVRTLVMPLVITLLARGRHEDRRQPGLFGLDLDPALELRRTRLGQQIIDERVSITHDPMDPQLGVVPELGMRPVTWIDQGRLVTLGHERTYALSNLREDVSNIWRPAFQMSGGPTSIEEMIATTTRGLIVTRFTQMRQINGRSLLYTGLTRDGFWLVENGKISKAVKNMRFTDSPLFVLNQVEQLGVPIPVFTGGQSLTPAMVPPVKSRDFAFTATVDAI